MGLEIRQIISGRDSNTVMIPHQCCQHQFLLHQVECPIHDHVVAAGEYSQPTLTRIHKQIARLKLHQPQVLHEITYMYVVNNCKKDREESEKCVHTRGKFCHHHLVLRVVDMLLGRYVLTRDWLVVLVRVLINLAWITVALAPTFE
jgi:hypothetical protein